MGVVTRDTASLPRLPYSPFTPSPPPLTDREPLPGPRLSPLDGRPHHSEPSMIGGYSDSQSSASSASGLRSSASLRMSPPVSSQPVTTSSRTQPTPEAWLPATMGQVSFQLQGRNLPAESSADGAHQQQRDHGPPFVSSGEGGGGVNNIGARAVNIAAGGPGTPLSVGPALRQRPTPRRPNFV